MVAVRTAARDHCARDRTPQGGTFASAERATTLLAFLGVELWRPVYGHPAGSSINPWFRAVDGFAYPAAGHPEGRSMEPWYRITKGLVYPAAAHPDGASRTACFKVVGNFVYSIAQPDAGPWFQIVDRGG
jgi:hypothetical protein